MTVGAVSLYKYSGNYSYDTTTQYKYFGMAVSDERLQQLMARYGIIQTGDSKNDLDALYQAMYSTAKTDSMTNQGPQQAQAPQKPTKPAETTGVAAYIPWENLMGQVGLIATGDLATDLEAFNTKLTAMQASATSQDQKATISLLEAEAAIVFVPPSDTKTAYAGPSDKEPQPPMQPPASGADIQAQLNKLYLMF